MALIEILVALLALASAVVLGMCNGALASMAKNAGRMRHVAHRRAMLTAEGLRYSESRRTVVLATQTAESAVEALTAVTQVGHSVLAATAFGTLESFSLTKGPAKVVRGVHDSIADGVFDSITALNKGIGSVIRRTDAAARAARTPPNDEALASHLPDIDDGFFDYEKESGSE